MSAEHLKLVLVLTAVDQGAGTMAKLCDALSGSWAEVEALVGELVTMGKLERVHDVVRYKQCPFCQERAHTHACGTGPLP